MPNNFNPYHQAGRNVGVGNGPEKLHDLADLFQDATISPLETTERFITLASQHQLDKKNELGLYDDDTDYDDEGRLVVTWDNLSE